MLRVGDNEATGMQTYTINDWEINHKEIATGRVYEPYRITIKAGNNIGEASQVVNYKSKMFLKIEVDFLPKPKIYDMFNDWIPG